ncbi:hypothetical protein ACIQC7_08995 [Kitasatospora sp. NPDC088556]|uniref:hypothetical protein n=1 Tax=Kitasatospora sp. NPDC088556 TaxID=3364076 RepID=UPI00382CDA82
MSEPENPSTPEPSNLPTPPKTSPADQAAEAEKWKALSRKNEERWKSASKELEEIRQTQMTDQEKALADARAEGRKAALSEVGTSLVQAEIRAQAAAAGVTVLAEYVDLNRFLADDGTANAEAVTEMIEKERGKQPAEPTFPKLQGAGYHRGNVPTISSMDPTELADLIAGGRFI